MANHNVKCILYRKRVVVVIDTDSRNSEKRWKPNKSQSSKCGSIECFPVINDNRNNDENNWLYIFYPFYDQNETHWRVKLYPIYFIFLYLICFFHHDSFELVEHWNNWRLLLLFFFCFDFVVLETKQNHSHEKCWNFLGRSLRCAAQILYKKEDGLTINKKFNLVT